MIAVHRLSQVDCLRAVAVLLVLGAHFQPPKPEDTGALVAVLTRTWMYGGWTGVDLFFVLSGFLVSGLLFREYQETGAVRPGRFLLRRGFKIYPAFYTMAIPILLLAQAPARQVVSELFLVQNYLLPNFFGYTWTLAVEAPSTFRIPISLVRCSTINVTSPKSPKQARTIEMAADEANTCPNWRSA